MESVRPAPTNGHGHLSTTQESSSPEDQLKIEKQWHELFVVLHRESVRFYAEKKHSDFPVSQISPVAVFIYDLKNTLSLQIDQARLKLYEMAINQHEKNLDALLKDNTSLAPHISLLKTELARLRGKIISCLL